MSNYYLECGEHRDFVPMRLIPVPKFLKCTCIDNSGSRGTGTCLQDSFLLKIIAIIDSPAGVLASPLRFCDSTSVITVNIPSIRDIYSVDPSC